LTSRIRSIASGDIASICSGTSSAAFSVSLCQARGFRGAELGYPEPLAADDPVAAALEFCRTHEEALIRELRRTGD
jgi:hypothetical protein